MEKDKILQMNVFAESKELNSIDFISKFNFKKLTCVSIVRVKLINNLNRVKGILEYTTMQHSNIFC